MNDRILSGKSWPICVSVILAACTTSSLKDPQTSNAGNSTAPQSLAGATLGLPLSAFQLQPDPHPPDQFIHLKAITWYVPVAQQNLGDVVPVATHYAFQAQKLVTVRLEIKGRDACLSARKNFESSYVAPAQKIT